MRDILSLLLLSLILSACNAPTPNGTSLPQPASSANTSSVQTTSTASAQTVAPTPQASQTQTPLSQPLVVSTPTPTPTASPIASPSPSPSASPVTVETFNSQNEGANICQAFKTWTASTETIVILYTGYSYSFAEAGVSVSYTTGPYNGQTFQVDDPTTLNYNHSGMIYECTLQVNNGAVQSIMENF